MRVTMTTSPVCLVRAELGPWVSTLDGINIAAGAHIDIKLESSLGTTTWYLQVLGTDELSTAPTLTNVDPLTHQVIDPTAIVSFISSSSTGHAILFQSRIWTHLSTWLAATYTLYTLTDSGLRVGATGETVEGNTIHGWTNIVNPAIRAVGTPITLAGDVTGPAWANTLSAILGRAISLTAPMPGQAYVWNGASWAPSTLSSFTAGGDLSGTDTSQTVIGFQGRLVDVTAPTPGQAYRWTGVAWVASDVQDFTAGGDLSGSNTNQTVRGLLGRTLSIVTPLTGQAYVWDGASWVPSAVGTVTDVSATPPLHSSGGATPTLTIDPATPSLPGSMSAADKAKLDALPTNPVVDPGAGAIGQILELFSLTPRRYHLVDPPADPSAIVFTTNPLHVGGRFYDDWGAFWDAFLTHKPSVLQFEGSGGNPCIIPPGDWDVAGTPLEGFLPSQRIIMSQGACFLNFAQALNLTIESRSNLPVILPYTSQVVGAGSILLSQGELIQTVRPAPSPWPFDSPVCIAVMPDGTAMPPDTHYLSQSLHIISDNWDFGEGTSVIGVLPTTAPDTELAMECNSTLLGHGTIVVAVGAVRIKANIKNYDCAWHDPITVHGGSFVLNLAKPVNTDNTVPTAGQVPIYDAVKDLYVPGTIASGSGDKVLLIYWPSHSDPYTQANIFTDWSALMTARAAIEGPVTIRVEGTSTEVPASIPAKPDLSAWDMTDISLDGPINVPGIAESQLLQGVAGGHLSFADHACFNDLEFAKGICFISESSAPILDNVNGPNPGLVFSINAETCMFQLHNSGQGTGTSPLFPPAKACIGSFAKGCGFSKTNYNRQTDCVVHFCSPMLIPGTPYHASAIIFTTGLCVPGQYAFNGVGSGSGAALVYVATDTASGFLSLHQLNFNQFGDPSPDPTKGQMDLSITAQYMTVLQSYNTAALQSIPVKSSTPTAGHVLTACAVSTPHAPPFDWESKPPNAWLLQSVPVLSTAPVLHQVLTAIDVGLGVINWKAQDPNRDAVSLQSTPVALTLPTAAQVLTAIDVGGTITWVPQTPASGGVTSVFGAEPIEITGTTTAPVVNISPDPEFHSVLAEMVTVGTPPAFNFFMQAAPLNYAGRDYNTVMGGSSPYGSFFISTSGGLRNISAVCSPPEHAVVPSNIADGVEDFCVCCFDVTFPGPPSSTLYMTAYFRNDEFLGPTWPGTPTPRAAYFDSWFEDYAQPHFTVTVVVPLWAPSTWTHAGHADYGWVLPPGPTAVVPGFDPTFVYNSYQSTYAEFTSSHAAVNTSITLGNDPTQAVSVQGALLVRTIEDTTAAGISPEIAWNASDGALYQCTASGPPSTWARLATATGAPTYQVDTVTPGPGITIAAGAPVAINPNPGGTPYAWKADAAAGSSAQYVYGVALATITYPSSGLVVTNGVCTSVTGLTPGAPCWLQIGGGLGPTPPPRTDPGTALVMLGLGRPDGRLLVQIQQYLNNP